MTAVICFFYFLFLSAGAGLIYWRRGPDWAFDPLALPGEGWPVHLLVSLLFVLLIHLLSLYAVKTWPSFSRSAGELRQWLGTLPHGKIFVIALASGIGEEVFFRGWLLNETGMFISSLIFGLVHMPPSRNWMYWPFFAFFMGLGLGWLCIWTETLFYAIFIHVAINYVNILRLPHLEGAAGEGEKGVVE
ncbi:MAG: CPBP family intramembrane glutamic endopeptidase [Opitutales bacterium]